MDADDPNSRVRLLQHLANLKATKKVCGNEGLPTDD
eukprot:COSAG04_NODE_20307_length_396_cov_1.026936_1_plen_35_part_01